MRNAFLALFSICFLVILFFGSSVVAPPTYAACTVALSINSQIVTSVPSGQAFSIIATGGVPNIGYLINIDGNTVQGGFTTNSNGQGGIANVAAPTITGQHTLTIVGFENNVERDQCSRTFTVTASTGTNCQVAIFTAGSQVPTNSVEAESRFNLVLDNANSALNYLFNFDNDQSTTQGFTPVSNGVAGAPNVLAPASGSHTIVVGGYIPGDQITRDSCSVAFTVTGGGAGANPCTSTECPTALGNIRIGLKFLAAQILQIGIGLAGGIALILMVVGAIRILISSGDQQKLNAGREMMIAAIAGLLFLLFATLILQFIGISILKGVPGIGA